MVGCTPSLTNIWFVLALCRGSEEANRALSFRASEEIGLPDGLCRLFNQFVWSSLAAWGGEGSYPPLSTLNPSPRALFEKVMFLLLADFVLCPIIRFHL
jgi:hypothetical protein